MMILSWLFFFHRKMRPMKENAPQGSHCGGMVECRLRDPPQAENPASQDSFLLRQLPVSAGGSNRPVLSRPRIVCSDRFFKQ